MNWLAALLTLVAQQPTSQRIYVAMIFGCPDDTLFYVQTKPVARVWLKPGVSLDSVARIYNARVTKRRRPA